VEIRICKQCKQEYIYIGVGYPKYCQECANQLKAHKHRIQSSVRLGTTAISQHFCGDFEKEHGIIKKELKRLGIKRH